MRETEIPGRRQYIGHCSGPGAAATGRGVAAVGGGWGATAGPRTLGLCGLNQGGGLDFVWQRGYGRLR
jgi:hypothetical protein